MNIKNFPKLTLNQVALIRAEANTGILLDESFNRHISDAQNLYSIFEGFEIAVEYVQSNLSEKVEFVIYDCNENVLLFQNPHLK